MSSAKDPHLARVKLHPAVIIFGCLLFSAFARNMWHLRLDAAILSVLRDVGIVLVIIGCATLVLAYSSMARAKTTIDPNVHTSKIVTSGIYSHSRNPIYIGWFLLTAGRGLMNASVLALLVAATMLLLLYWAVIVEEEAYLERQFGDEYLNYKKRVPRWFNMPFRRHRRTLCAGLLTMVWPILTARGQVPNPPEESYPARCGAFAGGETGFIPLPRGEVFCPLIADPKAIRSFVSYQRGDESDFARDIAAVGIGDQFGFFRFAGKRVGDGFQVGLAGAVFAQFDVNTPSADLLNADYLIGLPLSFRHRGFSSRLRVYHQSSHLGDEFLLREDPPERENLSFESADLLLSQDIGAFRGYAGGEYFFHREPNSLPKKLMHGGIELRPRASVRFGTLALARVVAAGDVKAVSDTTWRVGVSLRAGFEVGRPREAELAGRRWSLLFEYYDGPSPYGQFHRSDIRLTGLGIHFSL